MAESVTLMAFIEEIKYTKFGANSLFPTTRAVLIGWPSQPPSQQAHFLQRRVPSRGPNETSNRNIVMQVVGEEKSIVLLCSASWPHDEGS
jgi:hypothetical protein